MNNPPRIIIIIINIGGHSDTQKRNACFPPTPRTRTLVLSADLPSQAGPGRQNRQQHRHQLTFDRVEAGRAGDVSPVLRLVEHLGDGAREAAARQQAVRAVRPLVRAAPRCREGRGVWLEPMEKKRTRTRKTRSEENGGGWKGREF